MSQPAIKRTLPIGTALFVAIALILSPAARADTPAAQSDAVLAAYRDFNQGRSLGDDAAIRRSQDAFRQLLAKDPANPLFLVYYGSATTLQAQSAWAPWTKMRYAEAGLDAIDKALALLQPENETQAIAGIPVALMTRLVAMSTFIGVPRFFNRLGDAKDLLRQTYRSPSYRDGAPALKAAIAYQAALIARRGDSRDAEVEQLRQVQSMAPASEESAQAAARLKDLGL